jgi:hypothetical protein
MLETLKLRKRYSSVEDWTYRNLLEDILMADAQEVKRGHDSEERFNIIHYNSCTVQINYSHRNNLNIEVFGEPLVANSILKSLDKKVEEYNREYCNSSGLCK